MKKSLFGMAAALLGLCMAACTNEAPKPAAVVEDGVVDLGLSVKWATCNVGANRPEEYGNYYGWGEIAEKPDYLWSTYKFSPESQDIHIKYNATDAKLQLEAEDDAAAVELGNGWRIPTREEWIELRDKCTWTWTTHNGIEGYEVKGENGNQIFLPAAGYRDDVSETCAGSYGTYWSCSLQAGSPKVASFLYMEDGYIKVNSSFRYVGMTIRPVK